MAKSPESTGLKEAIESVLHRIDGKIAVKPDQVRADVRNLAMLFVKVNSFARYKLPKEKYGKGARARIREYMKLFVGQPIDGKELRVVSGIQEYARRVRELRVQEGYEIVSGLQRRGLKPSQYILVSAKPDAERAEYWQLKSRIRNMKGGSIGRVLALLRARVGKIVESEDLHYVAKKKDYDRRARQLRSEKGWNILTHHTGSRFLTPKQYLLATEDQLPEHDRNIKQKVYEAVLTRDGFKCVKCGWSHTDRNPSSKRQSLQVHHKKLHSQGGSNEADNLVTLCNLHHVEAHESKIDQDSIAAWLKS